MAKPLPVLRAPDRDPRCSEADAPRRSGRRGQVRSPCAALSARGGVGRAGRGGSMDSRLRGAAPDAAGTASSRAAPGCRASGGGRARRRRWAGTKANSRGESVWGGGAPGVGRLTIDPGQRAAARASGRRVGAVPCPGAQSVRAPPGSSRLAAGQAVRRAPGPPRAPDARGPLCAGRAPGPALRAAPRSDRRRRPCRGESARRARCQSAINAGPRPAARSPLARRAASAR